jgi:hypothetical protein
MLVIRHHFHTATRENTTTNRTELDIAPVNGQPGAKLFVTAFVGPRSWLVEPRARVVLNPSFLAVQYVGFTQRWHVVNLSGAPVPFGAKFDVVYVEPGDPIAFVHRTSQDNVRGNFTILESRNILSKNSLPLQLELLQVTPQLRRLDVVAPVDVWWAAPGASFPRLPPHSDLEIPSLDPRLSGGVVSINTMSELNHPVGVWFNESSRAWTVANLDDATMSRGVMYNVLATSGHGAGDMHRAVCVSNGLRGPVQPFCLMPCSARGTAFAVTVNMSYPYQGTRYSYPEGCGSLREVPKRIRNPFAVGVIKESFPVQGQPVGAPGSVEERTFLVEQTMSQIPVGIGFNILHILNTFSG